MFFNDSEPDYWGLDQISIASACDMNASLFPLSISYDAEIFMLSGFDGWDCEQNSSSSLVVEKCTVWHIETIDLNYEFYRSKICMCMDDFPLK